ncbi:MAG: tetratricopeptide repeat protein [Candidatus Eremiobacteraeota bacterium]|nr:tetratricopeptide repeat protein [Candidatus Eremiobacteraeota bacterium]
MLFVVIAAAFLAIMAYFVRLGFGTTGSVFGAGTAPVSHSAAAPAQTGPVNVQGGGPPAAVQVQLAQMRQRIAKNPRDDVALTQLGDTYLVVGKFSDAIPLYRRALKVNPSNAAAREGLQQARDGLAKGTP